MNFHVEKDGKTYAPCPGCGQRVELKALPGGETTCKNPGCKSTFPYHVPPGVGPVMTELKKNSAELKNDSTKRKPPEKWSKEFDELLVDAISRGGMKEAKKVLGHKFTEATLYKRAHRLGIEFENSFLKWSATDLQTLRELYPVGGSAMVCKALNGKHTRRSINKKAQSLDIRIQTRRTWTEEEDTLLRQTYPEGGIKAAFRVLGERHTKDGIQNRAQRQGLKSGNYKRRPKKSTDTADFSIQAKPGQTIMLRIEVIPEIV